eukprot:Pgem_evm1s7122
MISITSIVLVAAVTTSAHASFPYDYNNNKYESKPSISEPTLIGKFDNEFSQGIVKVFPQKHGTSIIETHLKVNPFDDIFTEECRYTDKHGKKFLKLNWHYHVKPPMSELLGQGGVSEQCSGSITGGHYDPTLACGPATDERQSCDLLNRTNADYNCNPESFKKDQFACEVGDLSGKFGQFVIPYTEPKWFKYYQEKCIKKEYEDSYGYKTKAWCKHYEKNVLSKRWAKGKSKDVDIHAASNNLLDGRSI